MAGSGQPRRPLDPAPLLGVDGDALMGAWLDYAVDAGAEREAAVEAAQVKRRLDRVQMEERRKRAYDLKINGASYRQVAEQLGIDVKTAWRDINRYVKVAVPESEKHVARKESIDRHQAWLLRLMAEFRSSSGEDQLKVVDRLLRVQKRLDELHGVDDPVSPDDPSELGSVEEVDEQRHALDEEIRALLEAGLLADPPPGHPG